MTKKNGKIHFHLLLPSVVDTITLGEKVEEGFLEVFHLHMRLKGLQIAVPRELDKDMLRWREMRVRHKAGDYRNTAAELDSTKAVAQWTVDIKMALCNQPAKKLVWV